MKPEARKRIFKDGFSTEELHKESMEWLSQLIFIRDEQKFLAKLLQDYMLGSMDAGLFETMALIVESLKKSKIELTKLLKRVQSHHGQLQVMVDDIESNAMEEKYLDTHSGLAQQIVDFSQTYKNCKARVFDAVTKVWRMRKQKKLR